MLDCKLKCGASEYVEDVANANWCEVEARLTALEAPPLVFSNETRPDSATYPVGTRIFNTDDHAPNYADGAVWRDAMGIET